jgi:hypothetical protein
MPSKNHLTHESGVTVAKDWLESNGISVVLLDSRKTDYPGNPDFYVRNKDGEKTFLRIVTNSNPEVSSDYHGHVYAWFMGPGEEIKKLKNYFYIFHFPKNPNIPEPIFFVVPSETVEEYLAEDVNDQKKKNLQGNNIRKYLRLGFSDESYSIGTPAPVSAEDYKNKWELLT